MVMRFIGGTGALGRPHPRRLLLAGGAYPKALRGQCRVPGGDCGERFDPAGDASTARVHRAEGESMGVVLWLGVVARS